MKRVSISVIFVGMLLGGGLFGLRLGNPAKAATPQVAQNECTLETLKGNYMYAQDGFNIAGTTAAERTPFAQSGREIFDGMGTMSGVSTASLNGTIVRSTYAGSYTVNSDCTGMVTFTDNFGQVFNYDIFIEDGGKEFVFIQTDAGAATAAYERRR